MAAMTEVCTGYCQHVRKILNPAGGGTGPGGRGRMSRKASQRKDIRIYILKDEFSWPDKGE